MTKETIYDIIGIGIGPFNLGMAALLEKLPQLKSRFIDQSPAFNWHAGLLLPNTRLQVPFFADLVTLADPTSKFSFLNFLKQKGRMIPFANQENNFALRGEYNQYCQWVISQLPNLMFGLRCEAVHFNSEKNCYEIYAKEPGRYTVKFHGKQIVIGVGTAPNIPEFASDLDAHGFGHPMIFHSSEYLFKRKSLLTKENITIIGSGQSAAEIYYDLLQTPHTLRQLNWFTRSEYPFPIETSPFAYEFSSPDYINYFFNLDHETKQTILSKQQRLYKGVNIEMLRAIYSQIYANQVEGAELKTEIRPNCELLKISQAPQNKFTLDLHQKEKNSSFQHTTNAVILATGYKASDTGFLDPVKELINWTANKKFAVNRNYSIDRHNTIFVQNGDLESHGFNSADLGLGPYRNQIILNMILNDEYFKPETGSTFQKFS